MVYTWALKGFLCPVFWPYVCTIMILGPVELHASELNGLLYAEAAKRVTMSWLRAGGTDDDGA